MLPITLTMFLQSISLLLLLSHTTAVSGGTCKMRGTCGFVDTFAGRLPVPCAVDENPSPVEIDKIPPQTLEEFQNLCTAYADLTNGRKLCCTHGQVADIINNFDQPRQLLGRCPSAMYNFASFFCAMTCDPNQGSFLSIVDFNQTDNMVNKIHLSVTPYFKDTFYHSAAGVSSTLGKAIDALCGDSNCNPVKFLKYLGQRNPAAFDIEYDFPENSTAPNVVPVIGKQCFEAPDLSEWPENPIACSCTDCPGSCLPPIDFDDGHEKKEEILQTFDMVLIAVSVIVAVAAVALTAYAVYKRRIAGSLNVTTTAASTPGSSTARLVSPEANNESYGISESRDDGKRNGENYITIAIRFWCRNVVFRFPLTTIFCGILLIILMSCGLVTLQMESDPVLLWSAADSRARIEKNFFDQNFGPFFRINTFIVSISDQDRDSFNFIRQVHDPQDPDYTIPLNFSGIFRKEFLQEILSLQSSIHSIPTLSDVCFKPVSDECMIQSPFGFFQSNASHLDILGDDKDYADHLANCIRNPLLMEDEDFPNDKMSCLSEWGGPGMFDVIFGGFSGAIPPEAGNNYYLSHTTSFVITVLLKNSLNLEVKERAEVFEKQFLDTMRAYTNRSVDIRLSDNETRRMPYNVSYYSERSVIDEIARQSSADLMTIAGSYMAMFAYIAISLGKITSFVKAKVSLGFAGVAIVLTSVTSSIGFLSFAFGKGIVFNLIIIEVIPFLILAVGVDNIFLMVQSIERKNQAAGSSFDEEDIALELTEILSTEAGPSILISSASEAGCFFIGSLASGMPAVKAFATTAGLSLVILLVLQFTVFLSLLFLDAKRERRGRNPDVLLWPFFFVWRLFSSSSTEDQIMDQDENAGGGDGLHTVSSIEREAEEERCASWRDPCSLFVSKVIVPIVTKVPHLILLIWILTSLFSLHALPRLSVGLDQETSVPEDSYVKSFFMDQKEKMRVGPPLFFVLNTTDESSFDFSSQTDQNLICSSASCNQDSLGNVVKTNSLDQEKSLTVNDTTSGRKKYISGHATSWLDEFLSGFIATTNCCSLKQVGNETVFCEEKTDQCTPCTDKYGRLKSPDLFYRLLPKFLSAPATTSCPSGGKAAYAFTVNTANETGRVKASYFSTYHLPCKNSSDFINSIENARLVADEIQERINNVTADSPVKAKLFPYSIFYVFYEQYLRTWSETAVGLCSSLLTVIVIVSASRVLKTWPNHIVFLMTMISFMLHLMAGMMMSSIELNAVSLVNLIMSIGISVEFTSHFMIAFAHESRLGTSSDIVPHVLQTTGSSILSGITLTKLIGIIVLGFASSRIFSLYYFRFYLLLVAVGAVHGLIYLPSLCFIIMSRRNK